MHGHLYGTPVDVVDAACANGRVVVLDIDVQGGASVRQVRPDAVSVFVYPPSIDALRQRLTRRGTDSSNEVARRLGNAPGELAQWRDYQYLIVNDNIEQAVATAAGDRSMQSARACSRLHTRIRRDATHRPRSPCMKLSSLVPPQGKNKYELAIVAAREARRLNDWIRRSGETLHGKVTAVALERVLQGRRAVLLRGPGAVPGAAAARDDAQ